MSFPTPRTHSSRPVNFYLHAAILLRHHRGHFLAQRIPKGLALCPTRPKVTQTLAFHWKRVAICIRRHPTRL
jgi:hypothetical protein